MTLTRKSALVGVFISIISSFIPASYGSFTIYAHAAENCSLTQDQFASLQEAQNENFGAPEQIMKELSTRKQLLSIVIDCSIAEAKSLQSRLNDVSSDNTDTKKIKLQLSDQIGNAINYYGIQKAKIADLGLQGSKNFAADLRDWRTGNYELNAKRISNFILWVNNQGLVETAKNRYSQIGQSVSLLNIVDNQDIQNEWKDTTSKFNSAMEANSAAKQVFLSFGSPDDSLNAIKSSLDSLALTYQKFFDTISAINKALHP